MAYQATELMEPSVPKIMMTVDNYTNTETFEEKTTGEHPCPNKNLGCNWTRSAFGKMTIAKAKTWANAHFHICLKNAKLSTGI